MSIVRRTRVALLMTSTTYRASAFLDAARRIGADVIIGTDRAQALAFAHPLGHLTLDFSDREAAVRALITRVADAPVDAIIATDDDGVVIASAAARALDLPSNAVAAVEAARDKRATRERLARAGVAGPAFRAMTIDDDPAMIAAAIRFPCVVKPLHWAASRGVMRADDAAQFIAAFRRLAGMLVRAGGGGSMLVEDFMPGAEVALEGLLTGGDLRVLAIFDKPDPLEGPFFEETLYVTPTRLDGVLEGAVVAATVEAVHALGLTHGPIHAELRVHAGRARVLEIAPRSIGGLCSRTLRFGDGASLEELILTHALGGDVSKLEREREAAGVMMIPIPRAGTLLGVRGVAEAMATAGVEEVRITIPIGHEVLPPPEGARYLGFIFARHARPEIVEAVLREAHRRLTFDIRRSAELGQARAGCLDAHGDEHEGS